MGVLIQRRLRKTRQPADVTSIFIKVGERQVPSLFLSGFISYLIQGEKLNWLNSDVLHSEAQKQSGSPERRLHLLYIRLILGELSSGIGSGGRVSLPPLSPGAWKQSCPARMLLMRFLTRRPHHLSRGHTSRHHFHLSAVHKSNVCVHTDEGSQLKNFHPAIIDCLCL